MTEFRIAFQDEGDQILDAIDAARATLDGDELRVTEQVVWNALERRGITHVGELLAELEGARARDLVDEARRDVGLPSLSEAASRRALTLAQRDDPPVRHQGPPRDHRGEALQECPHPDCAVLSRNKITKVIGPVAARRWHCPEHEGEAAEGDMDPWTPPAVSYAPGGGFMNVEQAADEARHYERLVHESREKALRRQEQIRAERERLAHLQELRDREARPLMLGGFVLGPGGKILNEPEQG